MTQSYVNQYVVLHSSVTDSKRILSYLISVYRGSCGEGEEINRIYDLLEYYCTFDCNDIDYEFIEEVDVLKEVYDTITNYETKLELLSQELAKRINAWKSEVDQSKLTREQKMQDMQFCGQAELILNRGMFITAIKMAITVDLFGDLPKEECPEEDENLMAAYAVLPIFAHMPIPEDINKNILDESDISQLLFNIVEKKYDVIPNMIHDYSNGNVCVRLWKEEGNGFVPIYTSVKKADVYQEKIINREDKALWPGIIEDAFEQLGISGDKEALSKAILGSEYEAFDKEYLFGPNEAAMMEVNIDLDDLIHQYVKCFFDTYVIMLGTNSVFDEKEDLYVALMMSLKESVYALACCIDRSLDVAKGAVDVLQENVLSYKAFLTEGDGKTMRVAKKRLAICETIEDVIRLYSDECEFHDKPRAYFEKIFANKMSRKMLESLNKTATDELVSSMAEQIVPSNKFKKIVAKANIHELKDAPLSFLERAIKSM